MRTQRKDVGHPLPSPESPPRAGELSRQKPWPEKMIRLLSYTIAAEAAVILLLVLENHLKMSGFVVVDWAKRGRGPTVVKSVAGALIVVLSSFLRASSRSKNGLLTPPRRRHHAADDQVVLGKHLLEAYLMDILLSSLCDFVLLFISLIALVNISFVSCCGSCVFFFLYYPLHVPYV